MIRPVRKPAESHMSAEEFRACLAELGLSITDAARFLRISRKSVERYAGGRQAISWAVAELLRLYVHWEIRPNLPSRKLPEALAA